MKILLGALIIGLLLVTTSCALTPYDFSKDYPQYHDYPYPDDISQPVDRERSGSRR